MDILDDLGQLLRQVGSLDGYYSEILPAILSALGSLDAQNHFRMVDKIAIDGKAVSSLPQLYPCRFGQVDMLPLLQDDDIRHDLRAGVGLERVIGEPDGPQQLRPLGQIPAHGGVFGVHGVAAGNKGHDSAGAHQIQRFCKEVVMNRKAQPVIRLVIDLIVAERHITHGHVKEVFGIADTFIALDSDAGFLIELLGDTPRQAVQFHAVQLTLGHTLRQATEEVAHAAGRLYDIPGLKPHTAHSPVNRLDDRRAGIVGVEGRRPGGGVLILGQQGPELGVLAVVLVKAVRQTAPAHILGQNLLFLRGGKTVLRLQLFQKPYGSDIACELLAGGAHPQGIVMDAVVMPLFLRDFRVQDGGRYFSGPARCRWGGGCFLPLLRLGLFRGGRGLSRRLDGLHRVQQMFIQGIFGQLGVKLGARHDILKQRAVRFAQGHILVAISHQYIFFTPNVNRGAQRQVVGFHRLGGCLRLHRRGELRRIYPRNAGTGDRCGLRFGLWI